MPDKPIKHRLNRSRSIWIALFLLPTVLIFLLIYAVPLVTVVGTSLFDYRLFPNRFEFAGVDNYVNLFKDPTFHTALGNTLLWILIHCTVHIALGVIIALLLYRKPKGWKFVRVAYMVPSIISNAAMATIFVNIYNPSYGVLNSVLRSIGLEHLQRNWLFDPRTALVSVTMIWTLFAGYTTTLVLSSALNIDESLVEAARVDGANNRQIDRHIILPLVMPMIGTTTIMAATYMLQLFDIIYITTGGGPGQMTTNLPLMLYQTFTGLNNYGYANTIGVVIIVLGFVTMLLINRIYGTNKSTTEGN